MEKTIHIALLGNCTTEYIARALKNICGKYNIPTDLYNCPYNQYNQEILNKESAFYHSNPDLSILFLEGKLLFSEWYELKLLMGDPQQKYSLVQSAFEALTSLVDNLHSNSSTKVLLNNFKIPYHSPLGILDGKYYPGLKDMTALLNQKLAAWASDKDYVHIFDYCGLSALFGNKNAEDLKMYYIANHTVSFPFIDCLVREYLRYILPLQFMTKKCLVLDLDNTLWGGVAGEDGISGIKLDITGSGKSFYDFQKEIINLYDKGIMLAVNSKNNFDDAMSIIENHPHMLLRKHHFSSLRINWNNKAENIMEIAGELNIGIDSIVFFDDNPVERELVKSMLPEVTVVELPPDTSRYADTIRHLVEFERMQITGEDTKRNEMYAENQKRLEALQQHTNIEDYLADLQTELILEHANSFTLPRIAQLTQKTNQFNMTTKRYTEEDLESMLESGRYLVFSCQVLDKFGDNGITGVCIVALENTAATIDTFLLSCRVLGRNVEYAFIGKIVLLLREQGMDTLYAPYIKTKKNAANENFYPQAGFSKYAAGGNETIYRLSGGSEVKKVAYIKIFMGGKQNGG